MFQCFIMMNLFNMVNCRVLDPIPQPVPDLGEDVDAEDRQALIDANKPNFNIFHRMFDNLWFWIVIMAELNVQFLMVGYMGLGSFFGTTPLTFSMHMTALGLGIGSWLVCMLIKISGPKLVHAMPDVNEDTEALERARAFSSRAHNSVAFANM